MTEMPESILSKQNAEENVKLLRASTVAYSKAKNGEMKVTYFLLFLSIAYPIAYLLFKSEVLKICLFGCSFGLTILIQIFSIRFKGNTAKGAIFKEEFDTIVFNLPWKSTLKEPDRREVLHLSQQYKCNEIKDWYSPNLSKNIEHNIAVAVLQHSNTSWDIELRKTYRKWLTNIIVGYSMVLFLCLVILKTDALSIFLLLFSLLSFFTHFISLIQGHSRTIEKRELISKQLDDIIHLKKSTSTEVLRDIQDEIYLTRQESAKVPNFFFRWYQKQINAEIEEYIREVNNIYNP
jgi:hypothetical protein